MKYAFALMVGAAAVPALATGFTTADLGKAAETARSQPGDAIADATETLRLGIAYDASAGIGIRQPGEQHALIRAFGTGDAGADLRAQWFMAGAVLQRADADTSILYNPLVRGWLALGWRRGAKGWEVDSAELKSSGPVAWTASADPYRKAFADDYVQARTVEPGFNADMVAFQVDRWLGGLEQWLRTPAHVAAANRLRAGIIAGQASRYGAPTLDVLPEQARATFWPVASIGRADGGTTLFLGSATMPHLIVTADLDARATVQRVVLINLNLAGGSK